MALDLVGPSCAMPAALSGSGHHPTVRYHSSHCLPEALDLQDPFWRQSGFVVRNRALSDYSLSFLMRLSSNLARLSVVDSLTLIHSFMALDLLDPFDAMRASSSGSGLCPDEMCPSYIYSEDPICPPFPRSSPIPSPAPL